MNLSELFPLAKFTMIDANEDAIILARKATEKFNATCTIDDIDDFYDI